MAPFVETQVEELAGFLGRYIERGPRPMLWVGAGASAAAGYPTLTHIAEILRRELPGVSASGYELVDAYVNKYSKIDLAVLLHQHLGLPRPIAQIHKAIARLAAARVFSVLMTTNYDRLLENALDDARVTYFTQVFQGNYSFEALDHVRLLKVHGDGTDWVTVIFSKYSYREFEKSYPLLSQQLDRNLRSHPVVFVGCSMTDPRLLDWLKRLSPVERENLHACRAILTNAEWMDLPEETRELLRNSKIQPILVNDHQCVTLLLGKVATRLSGADCLVFDLDPGEEVWTVTGPSPTRSRHEVANPLKDPELGSLLMSLPESLNWETPIDDAIPGFDDTPLLRAWRVSQKLTTVLFSDDARQEVKLSMAWGDRARPPRLVVRVRDATRRGDEALALPWELIAPEPGDFPVGQGRLEVVREAVSDLVSAPIVPRQSLSIAAIVAAPEDQDYISLEEESVRLYNALALLGQRVTFVDNGSLNQLVDVVVNSQSTAIHFSGHAEEGVFLFEDDYGLSQRISADEIVGRFRGTLISQPCLFFLAIRNKLDPFPSRAMASAALNRSGVFNVINYMASIGDELRTRAEEALYGALARGRSLIQSLAEARISLSKPIEVNARRVRYPLGWAQLGVYFHGPDSSPGESVRGTPKRNMVMVSGLPVLEHGFIGRRALQHEVRRRVEKEGCKLIVLQGLGGLGKTALASQLLSRAFASETSNQLILRCRGLDERTDPISELRAQAERHGKDHKLPEWEERAKQLRKEISDPVQGFAAVIRELRTDRPNLVLYVDNAESLQDGPKEEEAKDLGSWKPEATEWWTEMERLAQDGLVLVSTRYGWKELDPRSWVTVDPMSPADVMRMLDTFEGFDLLDRQARERLTERVDGHPRTLEILDRLIHGRLVDQGPGFEVRDAWADLVEPVLPEQELQIQSDLLLQELWDRLSSAAREHAIRIGVLRVPAPRYVVDKLGPATGELTRTSVLTRFREQSLSNEGLQWMDRWGLHSLIRAFVASKTDDASRMNAHTVAGEVFEEWVKQEGARWSDQEEGIHHFHVVGEGDRAWPMVQQYVLWLRGQARYREALVLLESCEAAGTKGEPLANALMLMAQMKRQIGERSIGLAKILDRALGLVSSDELKGIVLAEYGSLRRDQGEYVEAERLLRQSLDLKEKSLGMSHPDYGASLHSLAGVLSSQGKYVEGERLLRQSLELQMNSLGMSHPVYGVSLHSLARVLSSQGKYDEAEHLFRQSLDLQEKSLGVSHPSYGASQQGEYVEARRLLRQSLDLQEKSLGVSHFSYGASLHELAGVLSSQGKYDEAEHLLRQSLDLKEKSLGVSHPSYGASLHELAGVLSRQGKYVEADGLLRQSLEVKEKSLGVSHPSLYSTLTNLAGVLAEQGRAEEGEPFLKRALEIALQVHGPSHPDIAQILNMLAQLQAVLGRPEAAETARQALAALEATLGTDHPTTRDVTPILQRIAGGPGTASPVFQLVSQARAAAQRQDFFTAISVQEQVVALARAAGEEREVLVALSVQLFNLAGYYSNAGRHEDAVKALEEVVALDERTGHMDLESDRQALEEARRMAELSPEQRERRRAMLSAVRQIETLADQARDGVIAALRGETEREALIARIEEVAVKVSEGEEDGSPWSDLAVYLRGVAAFLRGEPVPTVPAVFAERMEAIEAAATGNGASTP